jgi:xanthine/CO dehydrogenase XdhC/CoxF family maturation factor
MLVTSDGWKAGSISGGCLEADITRQAAFLVANGQAVIRCYDTSADAGARLGCGGEIEVLLEPLLDDRLIDALALVVERREVLRVRTVLEGQVGERDVVANGSLLYSTVTGSLRGQNVFEEVIAPSHRLLIVGAGHDAIAVGRIAYELGWRVDVVDWRPALVTADRFPHAVRTCASSQTLAQKLDLTAGMVAVVMAHHVDYDAAALSVLLRRDEVLSVGLLGPRARSAQVMGLVETLGGPLSERARARLRAPVGLNLGGEGPAAIALSILAEAQAVLNGRDAVSLTQRPFAERAHG